MWIVSAIEHIRTEYPSFHPFATPNLCCGSRGLEFIWGVRWGTPRKSTNEHARSHSHLRPTYNFLLAQHSCVFFWRMPQQSEKGLDPEPLSPRHVWVRYLKSPGRSYVEKMGHFEKACDGWWDEPSVSQHLFQENFDQSDQWSMDICTKTDSLFEYRWKK